jgi:predicted RNase H-like HicB family nuclease
MNDIPIDVELGENGLYYGTSPAMKGLLVTGKTAEQVMERVPSAIAEMRAAAEILALTNKLDEAKGLLRERDEVSMTYPELMNWTDRVRSFLKENGE